MPVRIGPKRPVRLYIAEWRETRGLTQKQLGERLGAGVSDVTVSRWETGQRRPDMDVKAAIAEALGLELADLYRHPKTPSADALMRSQPQEVWDSVLAYIQGRIARR